MGQRILLECDVCGCKKEMSVGAGLLSRKPDIIASCLKPEEAQEWNRLRSLEQIGFYRAQQKVYFCDSCRDLRCQLTVEAELEDGSSVVFGDHCQTCGSGMREIDLKPEHMVCPVCHKGDMTRTQIGLWD